MKLKDLSVLITCGPTWVPIDDTRIISNRSTGTMGHLLAEQFAGKGARVTLLEGPVEQRLTRRGITVRTFRFFDELDALLKKELKKKYRLIVHAAAVSDFKPRQAKTTKISSRQKSLSLDLVPTKKLIAGMKKESPQSILVGFKLITRRTETALKTAGRKLIAQSGCDFVVANSVRDRYRALVLDRGGVIAGRARSRAGVVKKLVREVEKI